MAGEQARLDRKLGNETLGQLLGTGALPIAGRLAGAALFHEAPARSEIIVPTERSLGRRDLVTPEERDRELAHAAHPREGRTKVGCLRSDRGARGSVVHEDGPKPHREARLGGADPLDDVVVVERVIALEPCPALPLGGPDEETARLAGGERATPKTSVIERRRRSRGDGVRDQAHDAFRSRAWIVSTAASTTLSPR